MVLRPLDWEGPEVRPLQVGSAVFSWNCCRGEQPQAAPLFPSIFNVSVAGRAGERGATGREGHGWCPRDQGDLAARGFGFGFYGPHSEKYPVTRRRCGSPPICLFKLGLPGGPGPSGHRSRVLCVVGLAIRD